MYSYKVFNFILSILFYISSTKAQRLGKICTTTPDSSNCQELAKSDMECNYSQHLVDCLLNIQNNRSHLGRITAEAALLGANLLSSDVVVLGEIRKRRPASQTVVIVKKDIPQGIRNWRNKKLCHPGYKHDSALPFFLLNELEDIVIREVNPECDDNVTLLERRISTISNFFGESCRPGPWSQSDTFDKTLKAKYNSLCKLCGSSNCGVDYRSPFQDSLTCLVNNNADIAITTLDQAIRFFESDKNALNYSYVCKDGSMSKQSCIWGGKTSDLLVAAKSSAKAIENFLRNNLGSNINSTQAANSSVVLGAALASILNLEEDQITFNEQYETPQTLKSYLIREIPTIPTPPSVGQCGRTIKWCTTSSNEERKCKWLRQAAVLWGIEPSIECTRSTVEDDLFCLNDVQSKRADVVVASSDYSYITISKGLESIAFPEINVANLSFVLAVKRANDDSIKSFEDMKGKSACFPRFGGKEHLAFIDRTRSLGVTGNAKCNYATVLNDFVGNSCIPGVQSNIIEEATQCIDKDKFCAQCERLNYSISITKLCNTDENNIYSGNQGAVKCLQDRKGDFAVITRNSSLLNTLDLQVICKNNSLATFRGLDVDEDCALFISTSSSVVARTKDPINADIKLAFYEFERWFGKYSRKAFGLFDRFDNEKNFLFLDGTGGLSFNDGVPYIENYKNLLENVEKCNSRCDTEGSDGDNSDSSGVLHSSITCVIFLIFASSLLYLL